MKLLFLAPQPFFQERGTPIAVRLALQVLNERASPDDSIQLVTYHEGAPVDIPGLNVTRIPSLPFLNNIGAGISLKKLGCDLLFLFTTLRVVWRERHEPFTLVHAVEESVFIALLLKIFFKIPYVYDMDSSLAMQVTEKWWPLKFLRPFLLKAEEFAVRSSIAVVPVCDTLAAIADSHGSKHTHILRDISLLEPPPPEGVGSLREEIGAPEGAQIVLYAGNLERYQGVDLLLQAFAVVSEVREDTHLVVMGGAGELLARYRKIASSDPRLTRAHFIGQRPVQHLSAYIAQADVLAAPRILGNNTPMKIYSYLHSGKPMIATDIESHTQVLTPAIAHLAPCDPEAFAKGLLTLLEDKEYGRELGLAAKATAEANYTYDVFRLRLNHLYDHLSEQLSPSRPVVCPTIK